MECRDVLEAVVDRLSGELTRNRSEDLAEHMASCETCRNESGAWEETWVALGEDTDDVGSAPPSRGFRDDTLAKMEEATLARRVKSFPAARPPMRPSRNLSQIAAILIAGVIGYSLAKGKETVRVPGATASSGAQASFLLDTQRVVDVSQTLPDLSKKPRLANVAYRPADPAGKIAVSFDVTTRYTLEGKPTDQGIANVLAYLLTNASETEGVRSQTLDLVSQHFGETTPASPEVVKILVETLQKDKNPGVRKKAAEALSQLPATPEIRDALVKALKTDANPAVRILALDGLAKAAQELKDPASIETLRERASDSKENGYVRGQAALALKKINL